MMEEELSLLKKTLISLVVSSPTTITVSGLLKDYRAIVGGVLPLAKFGYREPIHFLRERCADIFVVEGPSWDPILTPKVTKNLAHIDQMVQKQKVQSTAKHKGKRRSILQPNQTVGTNLVVNQKPNTKSNDLPYRHDISKTYENPHKYDTKINDKINDNKPAQRETNIVTPHSEPKVHDTKKKENGYSVRHTDSKNENVHSTNNYKISSTNISFNKNEKENSTQNNQHCNDLLRFYKKRLPQYNSDMDFPSPDSEQNSKGSAESARQSSTSSTSKREMLDKLESEIITLVKESAEGIWCTDLLGLYKEKYGGELKFNRFGHTSIISLLYGIGDRVVITRPTPDGDWLIQDPVRQTDAAPQPGAAPVRRAALPDPGDALPGVDYDPDVFPPDCMHYMDSIPPAPLDELVPGAQVEVIVGEVYSPSHFWMLRVGPDHNMAMEEIMDEMNEYYRGEGAARALSRGAMRVGQYCAALYERDWHRSMIVSVIDSDTVKSDERYLYPRFSALESGATPNYADICRMLADGVALDYVDSYRRHVPGPWAELPAPPPPPPPPAPPLPAPPGLEMRLSEAEWGVLSHLRATDPSAAHWYLLSSAWRAMHGPRLFLPCEDTPSLAGTGYCLGARYLKKNTDGP